MLPGQIRLKVRLVKLGLILRASGRPCHLCAASFFPRTSHKRSEREISKLSKIEPFCARTPHNFHHVHLIGLKSVLVASFSSYDFQFLFSGKYLGVTIPLRSGRAAHHPEHRYSLVVR